MGSSSIELIENTFYRNSATRGGALDYNSHAEYGPEEPSSLTMLDCTLYGNAADQGGGIFCEGSQPVDLKSTIIAEGVGGEAIFCENANPGPTLACCDIYGNAGGDWVGCIEDQCGVNGNLRVDPLFCHPDHGNLRLSSASPCLPANNTCGVLIGAHAVGCSTATGIDVADAEAGKNVMLKSFPNPFNPTTRIAYTLPTQGLVTLSVYDVAGRLVETPVREMQSAGDHVIEWDAHDVPSGVYFCKLESPGVSQTCRLVLLR
jgi:hypothetical protein